MSPKIGRVLVHDGADGAALCDGTGDTAPLAWYEGSGTTDRRWLLGDERGSVIAVTDGGGVASAVNAYDEYGVPGATNLGRFGYTGQYWLGEAQLWDDRARLYAPVLGRFMPRWR